MSTAWPAGSVRSSLTGASRSHLWVSEVDGPDVPCDTVVLTAWRFANEVGEDLENVGVGDAGEEDTGNVVVENGSGVVSPPTADDLSVVLEDGDELHVARAEGCISWRVSTTEPRTVSTP